MSVKLSNGGVWLIVLESADFCFSQSDFVSFYKELKKTVT